MVHALRLAIAMCSVMTAVMLENVADATQSVKLHFSTGLMIGGADTSTDIQTDFSASIYE